MTDFQTRADLRAEGFSSHDLTAAVKDGRLIRARRDHYLLPDTAEEIVRAVRVGGRLTCLSLLQLLGVFVLVRDKIHIHVPPKSTRLRSPHDRRKRLESRSRRGVVVHWTPLQRSAGRSATVHIVDALVHAVRCQTPRAAVATLDSALHLGLIGSRQLDELFSIVPRRYAVLRPLLDARAESGTESIVRLMLRGLSTDVRPQARFAGIGRVDFLVDGWLIVECDSRGFHGTWDDRERDLRRDAKLAALGFLVVRLPATLVFDEPDLALSALRGALASRS